MYIFILTLKQNQQKIYLSRRKTDKNYFQNFENVLYCIICFADYIAYFMLPNICFVSFFVTLFTETKYQLGVFSKYCRVTWKLDNITEGHIMVSKTNETNDIHVVKLVHSFVVLKMNFVRRVCKIKMQIYIYLFQNLIRIMFYKQVYSCSIQALFTKTTVEINCM